MTPANILLDSQLGALLSDFGLAKLVSEAGSSVTAAGGIVGTPHYIAPEVWEGQGTTAQSDIYALGCILYELLTGEKLFGGESPPAVMMAHFNAPVLPQSWPEGVPPAVTDVLKTALAKQPDDRYVTAGELMKALPLLTEDEALAYSERGKSEEMGPEANIKQPAGTDLSPQLLPFQERPSLLATHVSPPAQLDLTTYEQSYNSPVGG